MNRIVAVHQPNYLPWLGYFYKIAHSDVFVFLDNVQYSKNSYQNRVQICSQSGPFWLTQPVKTKGNFKNLTNQIQFADMRWIGKHRKTLEASYGRHPYFNNIRRLLEIYEEPLDSLSSFNIKAIKRTCELLALDADIHVASSLDMPDFADATERLVSIVNHVGGTVYLSGAGGRNYHNARLFHDAHIELVFSDFEARPYKQLCSSTFVPGLSIVDAICNLGIDKVSQMLMNQP